MSSVSIREMSTNGMYVGAGIALVPGTITLMIASARIIAINLIANVILGVLTAGRVGIQIQASLIKVPFLWKVSQFTGIVGGTIFALSGIAALANLVYLEIKRRKS